MLRVVLVALVVLSPGSVTALYAADVSDDVRDIGWAVFSEVERRVIRDYYQGHRYEGDRKHKGKKRKQGLPPGLAKRDQLPPGLQKQLERNGRLPPGLQKRALPAELEYRLPPVRRGYERVIADNRVILVDTASGIIADMIDELLVE